MAFDSDYHVEQSATGDVTLDKNTDLLTVINTAPSNVTLPLAANCKGDKAEKTVMNDTTSTSTVSFVAAGSDTIVGITGSGAGDGATLKSDGFAKWRIVRGSSGVGATVSEAELVLADNTTANATSALHGFMPKLTPGVATASQPVTLGATKNLDTLALDALTGNDASFGVSGLAAAQGGAIALTGGTSSTAANAGGAIDVLGGAGGASGVGGAVSLKGGAGLGGAVGGAAVVAAGAGQGTGDGAIASLTGGASGAGATGAGGISKVVGGASAATDGAGGKAQLTGGLGRGTGAGGTADVTGGAGGATGIGGQVNISGGVPTDAAGGAVVIAGAAGVGTNRAGGLASVTGGNSTGSATGGVASLVGGAAGAATGTGGGVNVTGGAGNTSGAGGAAAILAGDGGTTGAGGNATLTAGRGGSTSGAAGVATITAGAGGATPSTVTGGIASLIGGGSGAGATGRGGAAKVTGGAALSTAGDGGAAIIAGGVKTTTGFVGPVVLGNAQLMPIWYPQAAPKADAGDAAQTLTMAEMIAGIVSATPAQARNVTTPTGAEMDAGVAFADVPATFGFDFTVQNQAAFAATDDILTLVAGASGVTVTGSAVISPGSAARFRAVRTTTATWIIYKISG